MFTYARLLWGYCFHFTQNKIAGNHIIYILWRFQSICLIKKTEGHIFSWKRKVKWYMSGQHPFGFNMGHNFFKLLDFLLPLELYAVCSVRLLNLCICLELFPCFPLCAVTRKFSVAWFQLIYVLFSFFRKIGSSFSQGMSLAIAHSIAAFKY